MSLLHQQGLMATEEGLAVRNTQDSWGLNSEVTVPFPLPHSIGQSKPCGRNYGQGIIYPLWKWTIRLNDRERDATERDGELRPTMQYITQIYLYQYIYIKIKTTLFFITKMETRHIGKSSTRKPIWKRVLIFSNKCLVQTVFFLTPGLLLL